MLLLLLLLLLDKNRWTNRAIKFARSDTKRKLSIHCLGLQAAQVAVVVGRLVEVVAELQLFFKKLPLAYQLLLLLLTLKIRLVGPQSARELRVL